MATCSFLNSTEARNLSRNNTIIWTEICEIQAAILAAIDGNEFSTIVAGGTPFTTLQEITAAAIANGGALYDIVSATAVIDDNGTGGTLADITPIVSGQTITSFTITNGGSGYAPVSATAALAAPSNLNDAQDETNYDGVGGDGTFTAGLGYFPTEVITLSESSTVTVDTITDVGQRVVTAAQDETNYDNVGANGDFNGGTSGYLATDTITLSDGTVITVDTAAGGLVTEFTVTSSSTTTLTTGIERVQLNTSGAGVGFSLTTDTNNEQAVGAVLEFTVASPGSVPFFLGSALQQSSTTRIGTGFTITPATNNVTGLAGGTGGAITPIVTNGVVTSLVVTTPGTGYIDGTPVVVTHPSGTGATANVSSVGGSGEILAATITNGGSGYDTVNALVTVTHPTGFAFEGTVTTTAGVVTGISIQDGGSLYGDLYPTVAVSDVTGSGAEINVTGVASGAITSIQLVDGGAGYSQTAAATVTPAPTDTDGTGALITLTIESNTFGTDPLDYYLVLEGQATDAVISDQLQYVIDYFTALGYNIRAQVNPATNNTIQWQLIW